MRLGNLIIIRGASYCNDLSGIDGSMFP